MDNVQGILFSVSRRKLRLIGALLLFSFLYSERICGQTGIPFSELSFIDSELNAFYERWNNDQEFAACLAIVRDGKLIYNRCVGKADTGVPAQPHHKFRLASISKPLTAVAIKKLEDIGSLNYSNKIFNGIYNIEWFEDYYDDNFGLFNFSLDGKNSDSRILNITIDHALTHRTGIGNDPLNTSENSDNRSKYEVFYRFWDNYSLSNTPGTTYQYSNFGYCALGLVIERVTGQTYGNWVKQYITNYIGATSFELAKNGGRQPYEVRSWDSGTYDFNIQRRDANGGWIATSHDVAKFAVAANPAISHPFILNINNDSDYYGSRIRQHGGTKTGTRTYMGYSVHLGSKYHWVLLTSRKGSTSYDFEIDNFMNSYISPHITNSTVFHDRDIFDFGYLNNITHTSNSATYSSEKSYMVDNFEVTSSSSQIKIEAERNIVFRTGTSLKGPFKAYLVSSPDGRIGSNTSTLDIFSPPQGTSEPVSKNEIKVYPNPTDDLINIHLSDAIDNLSYVLADTSGKIILAGNISGYDQISLRGLKAGIYLLKFEGESEGIRIIKQ